MKRLSFVDALFLYMETPETPMHVGSVTIFKPTSPRDDLFARFREHVAARLDLLPSYRRRLEPTPLGIDHPAWVMDDKLDLDYHIRHAALPTPGGMEELRALIAQLHAVPLDRSRPLWEYHFIEGLKAAPSPSTSRCTTARWMGSRAWRRSASPTISRPASEHEALPSRIVPPDAEPSDFIELTSTAIGDFIRQGWRAVTGTAGSRAGARQGRAPFRPRRALSLSLRQGNAADAVQQGDFGSPRLRDLVRCRSPTSRRWLSRGASRSTTSCWRSAPARCDAICSSTPRCPKSR